MSTETKFVQPLTWQSNPHFSTTVARELFSVSCGYIPRRKSLKHFLCKACDSSAPSALLCARLWSSTSFESSYFQRAKNNLTPARVIPSICVDFAMGAQQSTTRGGGGCPCFVLSPPFKSGGHDPLGSPVPDTPRVPKDRRFSKYKGLEKEVVNNQRKTKDKKVTKDTLDVAESEFQAQIHEGPVRWRPYVASLCCLKFRNHIFLIFCCLVGCRSSFIWQIPANGSFGSRINFDMPSLCQ